MLASLRVVVFAALSVVLWPGDEASRWNAAEVQINDLSEDVEAVSAFAAVTGALNAPTDV
ncbi:hypothetical protein [Curtobacterium flaccumfaciens]|uniref:hypothetical protein n=1 Tax=Curtobacterium flaccumfaciens TaxID=2035 RepID=UPI003CF08A70